MIQQISEHDSMNDVKHKFLDAYFHKFLSLSAFRSRYLDSSE